MHVNRNDIPTKIDVPGAVARFRLSRALIKRGRSSAGLARTRVRIRKPHRIVGVRREHQQQRASIEAIRQGHACAVLTRDIGGAEHALNVGARWRVGAAGERQQLSATAD